MPLLLRHGRGLGQLLVASVVRPLQTSLFPNLERVQDNDLVSSRAC